MTCDAISKSQPCKFNTSCYIYIHDREKNKKHIEALSLKDMLLEGESAAKD